MGHLGAILPPSCRQVRPTCCHFGLPAPVQNRPKSAKTASWTFFFQRSPPRPPRPPPGLDFPGFGVDFSTFLARFFLGFCFQFLAFCMDFLRGLTEEAQLERKGPAVLAAGVFDIRRPRVAVSRACLNRVSNPANSNFPTLPTGSRGVAARAQMPAAATRSSVLRSLFPLKLAILGHFRPS